MTADDELASLARIQPDLENIRQGPVVQFNRGLYAPWDYGPGPGDPPAAQTMRGTYHRPDYRRPGRPWH